MAVYDFVVVGSGIAGLSFALKASAYGKVLILTKKMGWSGSTSLAQGGIASVMSPGDSIEQHIQDTLIAGAGLCRPKPLKILVTQGPEAIQNLVDWGVRFTRAEKKGKGLIPFHLAREGGHTRERILHADDITGHEIQRALLEAARINSNIQMLENVLAIDLVTGKHAQPKHHLSKEQCFGLYALDMNKNKVEMFLGAVTVLCTGGAGQVYSHTTNDSVSTGDGIAMAYRAGASVEDMEFMQFHPTTFYNPGHPTYLISEALRGHGGILRNHKGLAFMDKTHPMKSLAPRDIVARAIDAEIKKSGQPCVYLDMKAFSRKDLQKHFPNIFKHCLSFGLDISEKWIPVVPAAHFMCGGVKVDDCSATNITGLYAVGETACTGVHGANRLASNSLLEAVVFSDRALQHVLMHRSKNYLVRPKLIQFKDWNNFHLKPVPETILYSHALETIKSTLWQYVGIVRSNSRLQRAGEFIRVISKQINQDYWSFSIEPDLIELRNLTLIAELIIKSAKARKESRGLHYNLDYPQTLSVLKHTHLRKRPN